MDYRDVATLDDYAAVQERLLDERERAPLTPSALAVGPVRQLEVTHALSYGLHPIVASEVYELIIASHPRHALLEAWHRFRYWLIEGWPELAADNDKQFGNAAFKLDGGCVDVSSPDMDDDTRNTVREGVHRLALGYQALVRNPAAHGRAAYAPPSVDENAYAGAALAVLNSLAWWVRSPRDPLET